MSLEVSRIQDQLARAMNGEAWHGPALNETLDGVTAEAALARPITGAHCIWEIVLHLAAWNRALIRRIQGEAVDLDGNDDWPPVADTETVAWTLALGDLRAGYEELQAAIGRFADSDLERTTPGGAYSFYVTLHGAVQHYLYHAGQIAILKKGA